MWALRGRGEHIADEITWVSHNKHRIDRLWKMFQLLNSDGVENRVTSTSFVHFTKRAPEDKVSHPIYQWVCKILLNRLVSTTNHPTV